MGFTETQMGHAKHDFCFHKATSGWNSHLMNESVLLDQDTFAVAHPRSGEPGAWEGGQDKPPQPLKRESSEGQGS